MCITRDGEYCPTLTPFERRAQHDFEERKGPYPSALVARLERDGIMLCEEHFRESLLRRRENAEYQLSYPRGFSARMDCSPQERQYMLGKRHEFPVDLFLPANITDALKPRFSEARKKQFHTYIINYNYSGTAEDLAFLLAYPEFEEWFAVFSSPKMRNDDIGHLLDGLLDDHDLLCRLSTVIKETLLRALVVRMCYRFFNSSMNSDASHVTERIIKDLPEQHRLPFRQLFESWKLLGGSLKNISRRRIRRQRKALSNKLKKWSSIVRDKHAIDRPQLEHMVAQLFVPSPTETGHTAA